MRVVIATVQAAFIRGGAEILAEGLRDQLTLAGHEASIVALPWDADSSEAVLAGIEVARALDLDRLAGGPVDRVIGLKFPAYLVRHPRKTIWLLHQHRAAYELWETPHGLGNLPDGKICRTAVVGADREAFGEGAGLFAISQTVAERLRRDHGRVASVLYPPPPHPERFVCGADEGYVFFPSRLTATKRHALVLQALAACRRPIRLICAGAADTAEQGERLRGEAAALGVAADVEWRGQVSDAELYALYAHCRAVVFPPVDEDYGYVAVEAMLARKPVVTCSDSGGPLELLVDGECGLVVPPTPAGLAGALERLAAEPGLAQAFGEAGWRRLRTLRLEWPAVLAALLGGAP